jgi:hypothetical protein
MNCHEKSEGPRQIYVFLMILSYLILTGLQRLCQNSNLPWDFVGVISCDFVDRFSRSVTGDPRNHTK